MVRNGVPVPVCRGKIWINRLAADGHKPCDYVRDLADEYRQSVAVRLQLAPPMRADELEDVARSIVRGLQGLAADLELFRAAPLTHREKYEDFRALCETLDHWQFNLNALAHQHLDHAHAEERQAGVG